MIGHRLKSALPVATATAAMLVLLAAGPASAAPTPSKFLLASHFGSEVDRTTGANVCTVASKDECQSGRESGGAGGFLFPSSVAVDNDPASAGYEHVYVADKVNHRVEEFTAGGQFVSMFGGKVNKKGGNVCTQAEGSECQAGVEEAGPGGFGFVDGIAVDPATGDLYVADVILTVVGGEVFIAQRVQAFTAAGQFLLEIGKEVNEATKGNVCAAGEACGGAALRTLAAAEADSESGAFSFEIGAGNLLAVGGPKDRLYVGDHARVQEFNASSGAPVGEISLATLSPTGNVTGVAVDPAGEVFVSDGEAAGVHQYDASGAPQPQVIDAASGTVHGLALDPHGRIGIIEGSQPGRGVLYTSSDTRISEFAPSAGSWLGEPNGLAFAASDELYVANSGAQEVEAYTPVVFPEMRTCAPTEVTGTSAKLCGEINPDGVPATGFFQYGKSSSLGSLTPVAFEGQSEVFEPATSPLTGLVPNQTYRYRVAVEAQAGGEEVQEHGEEVGFKTSVLAPQVPGEPSASFVGAQSAVLSASLNPEHVATSYRFEYGACPALVGCAGVQSTPEEVSSVYGVLASSQEVTGLIPSTTYSYRLVASNEFEEAGQKFGGKATGAEGSFTTGPAPAVAATTAPAGAVTSTSALISGAVNPDGRSASYAFEVGVYEGASTQYGVVFSGSAGSSSLPVEETLALTGLQPGTTYAYRIVIRSGYGEAVGAPTTFTTAGLAAVLSLPAAPSLVAVPPIAFPAESKAGKPSTSQKKRSGVTRACRKMPKARRTRCERTGRRKHPRKSNKKR
jgi:hypothetical protein